jgi:outer membrane protein assembly factor BamB
MLNSLAAIVNREFTNRSVMKFLQLPLILILFLITVATSAARPDACPAQSAGGDDLSVGSPAAWPRFLGPRHDGSAVVTAEFDFSKPPKFRWSIDVGDGYGIGSVADGRFYQLDAGPSDPDDRFGNRPKQERLRCFELATGKLIWTQQQAIFYRDLLGYEDGPRSSPTIVEDRIYTMGVTGRLICRDVVDGNQIWQVDTQSKYGVVQNFFGVATAPLVIDDMVIVMVGGSPAEDQNFPPMRLDRVRPNGSAVVAFNRHNGQEIWKCGNDLASYSSPIPVTIDDTRLVLLFARSGLLAIDPRDGKVVWTFAHRASILESVNAIVPLVDGNRIFISECYEVGSVLVSASAEAVNVLWQDPPHNRRLQAMRSHWSTPVLAEGFLYGCSGRNAPDSDFRCIELATGKVQWQDPRRIRSSVTKLGEQLLILEERGVFQVIRANPEKFDLIAEWDFSVGEGDRPPLTYPCWSAPVVVGDQLIMRGSDQVICLQFSQRRP